MKKRILIISTIILLFTSCSNDDSIKKESVLPITMKYVNKDLDFFDNGTYKIFYDGNKILNMSKDGVRIDYVYEGDLITKVVKYNIENGKDIIVERTNYKYNDRKLFSSSIFRIFSIEFPNGQYEIRTQFIYNYDGTITQEIYEKDYADGIEKKYPYVDVLTFLKGNLIKSVETNINKPDYIFTTNYEYDNSDNPLKNILGFSQLINHNFGSGSASSVNNIEKYITFQGTSQVGVYNNEILYWKNNRPSKITFYAFDGISISKTIEYAYNVK